VQLLQQFPSSANSLFAGKTAEAEALLPDSRRSASRFEPSGLTDEAKVEDYRLELNLDTAIVTCSDADCDVPNWCV
jgi:hypothetical protein